MKFMNYLIFLAFFLITPSLSMAQNGVVVVPLFKSQPNGVAAIPVYCDEAILSPGAVQQDDITCRRADTREVVTPVPDGHFLFISDVIINRNALANAGDAFIRIGVNSGTNFPTLPSFDFSVQALELNQIHFSTPYLVFQAGERIGAYNGDPDAIAMDIFLSGYLVKAAGFGENAQ